MSVGNLSIFPLDVLRLIVAIPGVICLFSRLSHDCLIVAESVLVKKRSSVSVSGMELLGYLDYLYGQRNESNESQSSNVTALLPSLDLIRWSMSYNNSIGRRTATDTLLDNERRRSGIVLTPEQRVETHVYERLRELLSSTPVLLPSYCMCVEVIMCRFPPSTSVRSKLGTSVRGVAHNTYLGFLRQHIDQALLLGKLSHTCLLPPLRDESFVAVSGVCGRALSKVVANHKDPKHYKRVMKYLNNIQAVHNDVMPRPMGGLAPSMAAKRLEISYGTLGTLLCTFPPRKVVERPSNRPREGISAKKVLGYLRQRMETPRKKFTLGLFLVHPNVLRMDLIRCKREEGLLVKIDSYDLTGDENWVSLEKSKWQEIVKTLEELGQDKVLVCPSMAHNLCTMQEYGAMVTAMLTPLCTTLSISLRDLLGHGHGGYKACEARVSVELKVVSKLQQPYTEEQGLLVDSLNLLYRYLMVACSSSYQKQHKIILVMYRVIERGQLLGTCTYMQPPMYLVGS